MSCTYIPWIFGRYIPTAKNRYAWKIDRRIKEILNSIILSRLEPRSTTGTHVGYGNDLLGIMMTSNQKELGGSQRNLSMTIDEIMDECKTFFFAVHETTSNLVTWAVFLLALNSEWKDILRKEVISICGTDIPDADMLTRMKSVCISYHLLDFFNQPYYSHNFCLKDSILLCLKTSTILV